MREYNSGHWPPRDMLIIIETQSNNKLRYTRPEPVTPLSLSLVPMLERPANHPQRPCPRTLA